MRMSLELVVIAIVILVVALVMLTIFASGIAPLGNLANARTACINAGSSACVTTGQAPFNWKTESIPTTDTSGTTIYKSCETAIGNWGTCCAKVGNTNNYNWNC